MTGQSRYRLTREDVQSPDGTVPLVSGRQALLRVFATTDVDSDFDPRPGYSLPDKRRRTMMCQIVAKPIVSCAPHG